jgi:hypothetical protein
MFIVIELQKNTDGTVANIVTQHDTQAAAESTYHMILANAAISKIPVHSAIIVSEEGFPIMHQCYKHSTV